MITKLSGMGELLGTILDAIPAAIFMVDREVKVLGVNQEAMRMLSQDPEAVIRRPAGEVLHCIHATETPGGCGASESCQHCLVRAAVNKSFRTNAVVRQKTQMELVREAAVNPVSLLITAAPIEFQKKKFVLLILENIGELMELLDALPVCARCQKVRDDSEYWQSVEKHFKDRLHLETAQDLCPECLLKMYMERQQA